MKNNKKDWIHSDNNIGKMFIDITDEDAYSILQGSIFNWCMPIFRKDKNGNKVIIGNVDVNIGDVNSEKEQ